VVSRQCRAPDVGKILELLKFDKWLQLAQEIAPGVEFVQHVHFFYASGNETVPDGALDWHAHMLKGFNYLASSCSGLLGDWE